MPSYFPPKKNTEFITYISLVDQSNTKLFKVNPTLAAGDVKVSTDGGAEANPGTLPAVTPAGSRRVKITLSASEMNGDNVQVTFSDAAGAEWCDLTINIQTAANLLDDLGTKLDTIDDFLDTEIAAILAAVDTEVAAILAAVDTEIAAIKAKTDSLTFTVANVLDANALRVGGTVQTAGDLVTLLNTIDDFLDTEVAAILAAVDTEVASILAAVDTEVAAIKAQTDKLTFNAANMLEVDVRKVNDTTVQGTGTVGVDPWRKV
jgi:hypothetical protein